MYCPSWEARFFFRGGMGGGERTQATDFWGMAGSVSSVFKDGGRGAGHLAGGGCGAGRLAGRLAGVILIPVLINSFIPSVKSRRGIGDREKEKDWEDGACSSTVDSPAPSSSSVDCSSVDSPAPSSSSVDSPLSVDSSLSWFGPATAEAGKP